MNPTDSLGPNAGIQMTHGTSAADFFAGAGISTGIIIFYLGLWVFYGYSFYTLSKKMNLKYSWMAFIPLLQYFNILCIAGKTLGWFLKHMLFPAIGLIGLGFGLSFSVSESFIVLVVIGYIWLFVSYIRVIHGVSVRTGHGKWWTLGLLSGSWIFVPVTAFHYEPGDAVNPRPFTGWRKALLIIFGTPIFFAFIGIFAAAFFPFMTGYLQASRDSARVAGMYSIRTALDVYYADHERFPDTDPSGCIPVKDLDAMYIRSKIVDPTPGRLMNGCDGSNGQTYAYRKYADSDGKEHYVIGVKMERRDNKNGNSNEGMIDAINSEASLMKGTGPYLYFTK